MAVSTAYIRTPSFIQRFNSLCTAANARGSAENADNAIAAAHGPLWIIHGHGTGKLRQGVQTFLTSHPRVERFEFAEQNDGGTGVTIAYCRG